MDQNDPFINLIGLCALAWVSMTAWTVILVERWEMRYGCSLWRQNQPKRSSDPTPNPPQSLLCAPYRMWLLKSVGEWLWMNSGHYRASICISVQASKPCFFCTRVWNTKAPSVCRSTEGAHISIYRSGGISGGNSRLRLGGQTMAASDQSWAEFKFKGVSATCSKEETRQVELQKRAGRVRGEEEMLQERLRWRKRAACIKACLRSDTSAVKGVSCLSSWMTDPQDCR